ncbi:ABC transporter permease [Leisingera daeponensis]|uniref:ABC transporter permease n=1 Tax=Leisingera daeponensis TaxID=405746 RepID=A0ABS7NL65_9RHOB|nr:ABC transporter permease [Leisingera daeponensis]MBY6056522.1 ABC transporter permease [Leisingera daeponensis]MBY6141577.1 ABC transporter permease [Leisingera daeponensis]
MFQQRTRPSWMSGFFTLTEVVFHSVVRSVRSKHNNAFVALGLNLLQTVLFVAAFYVMFSLLGLRGSAIRGDFLLYVMSGVYLFMVHTKTVSAVAGAEGPSSPMMQHAPMNTMVAILSAAIGALYIQVLSLFTILFAYHVAYTPVHIEEPIPAFGMVLLAWVTGVGVGLVFLVLKPWAPSFVSILTMIYQRANMIASGKMFLANTLPSFMLAMFDWNPLFHCIDQSRGFVFINYNPHFSSWEYAAWVALVLIVIGLMGEFYTRRHASLSWNARR